VHEKKDLAETIRRRRGRSTRKELSGHLSCSKCGTRHARADVYEGRHDIPEDQLDALVAPVEVIDEAPEPDSREEGHATTPPSRGRDRRERRERTEEEDSLENNRRKSRSRRQGLAGVNVGLAIHYGAMATFLLGLIAGWVALLLLVIAVVSLGRTRPDQTPSASALGTLAVSGILFLVSFALIGCASIADVVSSAFCLRVPDGKARGLLIAALCVRLLAVPVGLALLFFAPPGLVVLCVMVLALIGWALWVGFLHTLAQSLKQPVLAQESVDVSFSALKLGATWVVGMGMLIGAIVMLASMKRVGGCFAGFFIFTFVSLTAGIIRYLVVSGRFDSLLTLVLYPTGIPVIMRYLDLISSLRMIILRRA
jgi:hypothetical protein